MLNQIMIDLETLGHNIGSVILSIGACGHDRSGVFREFHILIDPKSQAGKLNMDFDTFYWWLKQSDDAREQIANSRLGAPIGFALGRFVFWCREYFDCDTVNVWSCGASFDLPMLGYALNKFGMSAPWKFWNERCYRTLKALNRDVKPPEVDGTAHNALDDAKRQYRHAQMILEKIQEV